MRVVVTGGAGFIGSHLVDAHVAAGDDVIVIDDFRSGETIHPRARLLVKAVSSAGPEPYLDAGVIYHLASPVGPVGVLRYAGRIAWEVVTDASLLAGAALAAGCPLVYVSTSELYGPQTGACAEDLPRVTPAGHSARMEYAVAKLAAETMLLNTPGLDVRIVRPFNVAGPRQKPDGGFVLPRFIRQAAAGQPLTVYGAGSALRAFTHVADIVAGLMAVAERGRAGDVYNLGNPANLTTIRELAELVLEVVNPAGTWASVDPVALWGPAFREAADKYPDITNATSALGWRPARDLRAVVVDTARATGAIA